MNCVRCLKPAINVDVESGHRIHRLCLMEWWHSIGALPAPIVIGCGNGPDVVIGQGTTATATPDDDDPELLRRRGVFT